MTRERELLEQALPMLEKSYPTLARKLCDEIYEVLAAQPAPVPESFQSRVLPWMHACFGEAISRDTVERNHRFLEESIELVQACGCTQGEAHQLVDYVFGRPTGEPLQEVGGVMVTLAALCLAQGMDMHEAGETELARIWTKVEQIRAKQAAKPKHSPLPSAAQPAPVPFDFAEWHGNLMMLADAYWEASSAARFRHREQLRQHALNVGQHWKARAMLSAAPVPVPMTESEIYRAWDESGSYPSLATFTQIVRATESRHRIAASPEVPK